jgi:hypothetical protein
MVLKLESGQAYNCLSIVIITKVEFCYTRNVREYRPKGSMKYRYKMDKGKLER